ncbi:PilZ domain-containing protein [Psychrobium sp. 1_MG-2023]|uniref:PilZ domain-containing protein n=1 Tax=Psychrobium sp. 1_MG-2023 TaxID=3062624 RepID=UPI000C33E9DB|nr:PilZ domain-containing protein [Psychrobium sp. 1_MG-2023]MDP2561809.1 PilZ domain-containing protein [Psychrobium sp. 1_MG-2023]PKF55818.1 hypothetical protein CW748_11800 [Alteromonadales bacterium alter-6D02]
MPVDTDHALISSIIPYFHDQDFNQRFEDLTLQLSKSRRFLVKMEVNRLYSECSRAIDLRGRVDGECREFQFEGLTHHLDDLAIETFNEAISVYSKYTTGVFEEVSQTKNSYREQQDDVDQLRRESIEEAAKQKRRTPAKMESVTAQVPVHHAKIIDLAQFHLRKEERINTLSPVTVRLANGRTANGITSNLSVHGAKVKLASQHAIRVGDTLYVKHNEIEQLPDSEPVNLELAYTVLNIQTKNEASWYQLERQHLDEKIDSVLQAHLKIQKNQVTTDVEHVIDMLTTFGYQQLYSSKFVGLPIFFSQNDDQYHAEYALCNPANRHIINYWQSSNNILRVTGLLRSKRLTRILKLLQSKPNQLLYCFTHIAKGKKYFYSATDYELKHTGLTDLFMQFGAKKEGWRVYQLQLAPITDHQWRLPNVLPKHLTAKDSAKPEQHQYLESLSELDLMGYLIDITSEQGRSFYQQRQPKKNELAKLKVFCHSDTAQAGLKLIDTNYQSLRQEDRFNYQTPVIIHHNKQTFKGSTVDFSVHGMQILMKQSVPITASDIIKLEFPLLAKVSGNPELAFLQYQVMRATPDGKQLNLKIEINDETEHGPKLIYKIIKNNKRKLTAQIAPPADFNKLLKTLHCEKNDTLPIIISKKGNTYKVSHLVQTREENRLLNLFSAQSTMLGYGDTACIAKNNLFNQIFANSLKKISPTSPAVSQEIYIQLSTPADSHDYHTSTRLFEEFETKEDHQAFITLAKQQGEFFAIRIYISRTNKVDYKAFSRELIYAAKQSSFKTRQLQAQLDSVIGIAEMTDISEEVLQRFDLI